MAKCRLRSSPISGVREKGHVARCYPSHALFLHVWLLSILHFDHVGSSLIPVLLLMIMVLLVFLALISGYVLCGARMMISVGYTLWGYYMGISVTVDTSYGSGVTESVG
jgi:hypothetical protein